MMVVSSVAWWRFGADAHQTRNAFFIAFLGLLALHQWGGVTELRADAAHYWQLSAIESLLSYPQTFRGYVYPLLLSPARAVTDLLGCSGLLPFRVFSSAIYAYLLTGPIANGFVGLLGGRLSLIRRLALPVLVAVFFPGLVLYPLTDLPAFLLLAGGVFLVGLAARHHRSWPLFLAGVLVSASYNVRTVYMVSFAALLLLIPLVVLRNRPWLARGTGLATFLLGAALVAVPQLWINLQTHQRATPLVITTDPGGRSLNAAQLQWGITLQRYETFSPPKADAAPVYYLDKGGEVLFTSGRASSQSLSSISSYFRLVLKRPIDFLGIYGRHLVNGIDVRDGMVYLTKDSRRRSLVSFANFCIVAIAVLVIVTHRKLPLLPLLLAAVVVLPVLAILPGAVETRFFFPLHLLMYATIACGFRWQAVRGVVVARPVLVIMVFLVALATFMAITTATMASVSQEWPTSFR